MVNVTGYAPSHINCCPECGNENIEFNQREGKLNCEDCGLEVYLVEGENSHTDS